MEISKGKGVPSFSMSAAAMVPPLVVEKRIDELAQQKVFLQTKLQRLHNEGVRSVPFICSECSFLEAGKAYTVEDLTRELQRMLLRVQREEKSLQEQCERTCVRPDFEKHFADVCLDSGKKAKIESERPMVIGKDGSENSQALCQQLQWAEAEKKRLQEAIEALRGVQHTAENLDEIASHVGMMGQASVSEMYRHIGSKILTWTDQIHFIENKLKVMQQVIIEEQVCKAIDSEDVHLLLRLKEQYPIDFDSPMLVKGEGLTPLTYAIDKGHTKMVFFLFDTLHVNPNQVDQSKDLYSHGMTPLLRAIARGDERIITFLLRHDVFVDFPVGDLLPISYAISLGRRELVLKLIDAPNVNLNRWAAGGMGPIQAAIVQNDISLIQPLQAKGADINSSDGTGASPLTYALSQGHREVAQELIQLGADPKHPDRLGRVPEQMIPFLENKVIKLD